MTEEPWRLPPVSVDHIRPLGIITAYFQLIEVHAVTVARMLMQGDQDVAMMATAQMPFARLCDYVGALAIHRFTAGSELRMRCLNYVAQVKRAENERNQLIHSMWFFDFSGTKVSRQKVTANAKHGLRVFVEELSPERLDSIANDICGVVHDGHVLLRDLSRAGFELSAS